MQKTMMLLRSTERAHKCVPTYVQTKARCLFHSHFGDIHDMTIIYAHIEHSSMLYTCKRGAGRMKRIERREKRANRKKEREERRRKRDRELVLKYQFFTLAFSPFNSIRCIYSVVLFWFSWAICVLFIFFTMAKTYTNDLNETPL